MIRAHLTDVQGSFPMFHQLWLLGYTTRDKQRRTEMTTSASSFGATGSNMKSLKDNIEKKRCKMTQDIGRGYIAESFGV